MRLTGIDISHLCDIEVIVAAADFIPADRSDYMSTDECSIEKMSATIWIGGHKVELSLWESTRYGVSQEARVIELIREKFHKESEELMTDEDYPQPLVKAKFRGAA